MTVGVTHELHGCEKTPYIQFCRAKRVWLIPFAAKDMGCLADFGAELVHLVLQR